MLQMLMFPFEAESVAYCVCSSFGLDTSDYSFPYIAGWSSSREMKEMKASMDVIRKTAGEMIDQLTEELEIILEEKQKTELHDKYGILVDALEAAGYRYDYRESEPGHIVLTPDGTHEIAGYLQFESWGDISRSASSLIWRMSAEVIPSGGLFIYFSRSFSISGFISTQSSFSRIVP